MERSVLRFAQNIRVYRSSKEMIQEQLAMLVPVSRQTVSLWEKGVSSPDAYTIVKPATMIFFRKTWKSSVRFSLCHLSGSWQLMSV